MTQLQRNTTLQMNQTLLVEGRVELITPFVLKHSYILELQLVFSPLELLIYLIIEPCT